MKKIIISMAFFLFISKLLIAQDTLIPTHQQTIDFIEQSIIDLKSMDPAGDIPSNLKENYNWFQTDMATCEKQEYFEGFLQNITDNYKQYGKFATVKFTTATDGAVIKFQTVFEKIKKVTPRQADNPTNTCVVQLAPGQYYVWSERKGKITSDIKRRIYIKLNTPTVTITEN